MRSDRMGSEGMMIMKTFKKSSLFGCLSYPSNPFFYNLIFFVKLFFCVFFFLWLCLIQYFFYSNSFSITWTMGWNIKLRNETKIWAGCYAGGFTKVRNTVWLWPLIIYLHTLTHVPIGKFSFSVLLNFPWDDKHQKSIRFINFSYSIFSLPLSCSYACVWPRMYVSSL